MSSLKVAFLYSEIAGYFMSNIKELAKHHEVLIFRWPINSEAPFNFKSIANVTIKDRSEFSQDELESELKTFSPDILVCSGWMDKGYVKAAKSFKRQIPIVLTLDNHWTGGLKQRIASILSSFYLKKIFTHAWVPGDPQAIFAKKLGYSGDKLIRNFYCADVELFLNKFEESFEIKRTAFPKRFLYVARYVEHKGIYEMWQAFKELKDEGLIDWELWCLGTGDEWGKRVISEGIEHFGFVQPTEMGKYLKETGVYILPSKFEPWGVTVQEFAISGFPMMISSEVGAKHTYLSDNGFEIKAGDKNAIKEAMLKFAKMTDAELIKMGERSNEIGLSFNNKMWVDNLIGIKK
ncbi:MAG: glycosyltransferase involved in cell wall biosynthesis [Arenicella sp.]|jgi:glycosyltransferase involved in cell wall biosynthesis